MIHCFRYLKFHIALVPLKQKMAHKYNSYIFLFVLGFPLKWTHRLRYIGNIASSRKCTCVLCLVKYVFTEKMPKEQHTWNCCTSNLQKKTHLHRVISRGECGEWSFGCEVQLHLRSDKSK